MMAGETLAYFHERIRQIDGKDVAGLAMGDFNDEPFNRSLREYALAVHERGTVTRARSPKRYGGMGKKVDPEGFSDHYPVTVTVSTDD